MLRCALTSLAILGQVGANNAAAPKHHFEEQSATRTPECLFEFVVVDPVLYTLLNIAFLLHVASNEQE
jgi:hypothetical protein